MLDFSHAMKLSPSQPSQRLMAGSATADLTPKTSVFLFGYPHVPRMSTGVHDPLNAAALYLRNGEDAVLFIANDVIYFSKELAAEVRRCINRETGVPPHAIAITATHTHSGPVMLDGVGQGSDPVVPKVDAAYVSWVASQLVAAACAAVRNAVPAEAGLAVARAEGVGTNRHDPAGPADPDVPVLLVRARSDRRPLACMIAYAMHPTVLHQDSKLISSDFPHFTRQYLRDRGLVPADCPILYHNGAAGNQSPRHVTKANTFAEARRLGELLGATVAGVIPGLAYDSAMPLRARHLLVPLERRALPPLAEAEARVKAVRERFAALQAAGAPRTEIRTAECDVFGAEKTVVLARLVAEGRLDPPGSGGPSAEIQVIELGRWKFVLWPGEFFVEYALQVKAGSPDTFVITLANGELQGYIVTPEAVKRGVYEATNALFSPDNGRRIVEATLAMLAPQG